MRPEEFWEEADSAEIRRRSSGAVTNLETLDFRTLEFVPGGLYGEPVFGPPHGWICRCGGALRTPTGFVCERCGVAVTREKLATERIGHIDLATPVVDIRYLHPLLAPLSQAFHLTPDTLRALVYGQQCLVRHLDHDAVARRLPEIYVAVEEEQQAAEAELDRSEHGLGGALDAESREALRARQRQESLALQHAVERLAQIREGAILSEVDYHPIRALLEELRRRIDMTPAVQLESSSTAVRTLLERADPVELDAAMHAHAQSEEPDASALRTLMAHGLPPSRLILDCIPVIPPALRPFIAISAKKWKVSHLNDLYRHLIHRNNRLRKLRELKAPMVIVDHETSLLQRAADALFDNRNCLNPVLGADKRPLMSLTDFLNRLRLSP